MSRTRRNLAYMMLSQMSTFLLAIFTVTIVPKYLGAETYGVLAFATAFVGFFVLATSLGTRVFLVKTIAREPGHLGSYVFNGLVMKIFLGSALAVVGIGMAHVLGYSSQTITLIELGFIGMIFGALIDVLAAGLQGTERMGKIAFWSAAQMYVGGAIAIVLLLDHKGVLVYALVMALAAIIPVVANGYQLWPEIRKERTIDLRLWRVIAVGGLPFVLWGAILLVYGSIDILMLQEMNGSQTVGWYTLAYSWVGIPIFLPTVLVNVVYPSLSNKALGDTADFNRIVNKALQLVVFVGTPMAIGIALVAGNIIGLFHYPASFQHAVPLIRILAIHIPIVAMDMILAAALISRDRQKVWLLVGCIAAVFNPAINLIAIPLTSHRFGNGAIGASVVTVATELVMMIGAIYLRPAGILDRSTVSFLLRCVAASVAMIPFVLVAASAPFAVKVIIGATVFCIAALGLRLVSLRESRDTAAQFLRSIRDRGRLATLSTSVES
jgi:O-antigen/teichoic acid export membrane protein